MMVQYLVGLCCLRHDPDAIDVTIGDMVMDDAAGKERDVDVTTALSHLSAPSKVGQTLYQGEGTSGGQVTQYTPFSNTRKAKKYDP